VLDEVLAGRASLADLLTWVVGLLIAISVHEFAHAKRAQLAGDPTPARQGRVTLNPLAHLDPIGTLMLLLFGLGWGRPVQTDPGYYRRRRWDQLMVAAWGPLSNIVTAALFALPLRLGLGAGRADLLGAVVFINLMLAFFNLLPVYPLDGAQVVTQLLPPARALGFALFMHRYGIILLLGILLTPVGRLLFALPARWVLRLMTGL
jgi:Zn-dependent protease